jgi:hypothetical protein
MKNSNAPSLTQIMSGRFAASLRFGIFWSVATALFSTELNAETVLLEDTFTLPTGLKGEMNESLLRQTGRLAPVAYGSNTKNSGPGGSGYAYINENQALELNPDKGGTAIVWTEAPVKTTSGFHLKVNVWPTVTQNSPTGAASIIFGSDATRRKLSESEQEKGDPLGGFGIRISGSGRLEIRDFSKSGKDQLVVPPEELGPKNTFRSVEVQVSQSAGAPPGISISIDNRSVLKNYVRSQGLKDGYISFVVSKGEGDTQSVFDDFRLEEIP